MQKLETHKETDTHQWADVLCVGSWNLVENVCKKIQDEKLEKNNSGNDFSLHTAILVLRFFS